MSSNESPLQNDCLENALATCRRLREQLRATNYGVLILLYTMAGYLSSVVMAKKGPLYSSCTDKWQGREKGGIASRKQFASHPSLQQAGELGGQIVV